MNDIRHGQVRVHGILSNSYKQAVVSLTHKNVLREIIFMFFIEIVIYQIISKNQLVAFIRCIAQ